VAGFEVSPEAADKAGRTRPRGVETVTRT